MTLTSIADAPKILWSPLNKNVLAHKRNTKSDTILNTIETAHQDGNFAAGIKLCNVVISGIKNKQKKFVDTMKVTLWLINKVDSQGIQDTEKPLVDVCHISDKAEEKHMRHVVVLKNQKECNSSRLQLRYTGVGTLLQKLRKQGIKFFCGLNGTWEGNNLIQSMFDCNILAQPEHKAIDVDDVEA